VATASNVPHNTRPLSRLRRAIIVSTHAHKEEQYREAQDSPDHDECAEVKGSGGRWEVLDDNGCRASGKGCGLWSS
jgi:hypothetical protein